MTDEPTGGAGYYTGRYGPEIDKDFAVRLKALDVRFLDTAEANAVGFERLFRPEFTKQEAGRPGNDYPPLAFAHPDMDSVLIPFAFEDADKVRLPNGAILADAFQLHVNQHFRGKKRIFITDWDETLAAECNYYMNEILYLMRFAHINSSFVLFGEDMEQCFIAHYEISAMIFAQRKGLGVTFAGMSKAEWIAYFNDRYLDGMADWGGLPIVVDAYVRSMGDQYPIGDLARRLVERYPNAPMIDMWKKKWAGTLLPAAESG
ncbi:MAG: hypothetical protein WAT79_03965 [Saprospiraceae bacterium]